MHRLTSHIGTLVGRILIAALFLVSGVNKALGFAGFASLVEQLGVPMATAAAAATVALEIIGGIAILVGAYARYAALALAAFVVVATVLVHRTELTEILKNGAVIGGLLYVAAQGTGGLSLLDRGTSKTRQARQSPQQTDG
jgi:putative oxidoreductase